MLETIVVFEYPFKPVGKLIKEEWCTAETKGKEHIDVVLGLPEDTQQAPVVWMNWYQAKSRFEVGLGHEGTPPQGLKDTDGVVDPDITQGKGILRNIVVNAGPLKMGEVVDCAPFI